MKAWLLALLACTAAPALAAWDAALYAYPEIARLQEDGPLNPGNRVARLAETRFNAEARLHFKYAAEDWQISLRPLLAVRWDDDDRESRSGYLGQGQIRARLGEAWNLSLGREVMNWGPAQFRSPSSPFYFDNGRSNPLRELSGVDNLKLAWTPDSDRALSLARIQDSGHGAGAADPWRHTWLARADLRGDDWAAGLVLARAEGHRPFLGGHGQWTLNDAWLLYGELGSSHRLDALVSPADPARPFRVEAESPRRLTALLGASLTLENGHSLALEWLRDQHGYRRAEAAAYFQRAAASPALAGLALGLAPPLLGRDYLHLVWQNNPLGGDDYFRVMASHNLGDGGVQLAAYGEHALNDHWSLFALGVANPGGARREFSSLMQYSLALGLRLALP